MLLLLDAGRLLQKTHGYVGWLAVAALAHPAWLLRRERAVTRRRIAPLLATLLLTLAAALGFASYEAYRAHVQPPLFRDAPWLALLFERKEHLAFGAIALAWVGLLSYGVAVRDPRRAAAWLRSSWLAYAIALALALFAAIVGSWVASTSLG